MILQQLIEKSSDVSRPAELVCRIAEIMIRFVHEPAPPRPTRARAADANTRQDVAPALTPTDAVVPNILCYYAGDFSRENPVLGFRHTSWMYLMYLFWSEVTRAGACRAAEGAARQARARVRQRAFRGNCRFYTASTPPRAPTARRLAAEPPRHIRCSYNGTLLPCYRLLLMRAYYLNVKSDYLNRSPTHAA
ncbi:hypothetical protein EVAR_67241_1 [Eumeta japonica]|uniref:Uncharacterized protein n=1 Tax=Eumeta variegata TaxID=151549 RepID=A0A4C1YVQ4_EUMVA|nr:hypothetical protein EVAR_67241_1 [Eumeta japonica]